MHIYAFYNNLSGLLRYGAVFEVLLNETAALIFISNTPLKSLLNGLIRGKFISHKDAISTGRALGEHRAPGTGRAPGEHCDSCASCLKYL